MGSSSYDQEITQAIIRIALAGDGAVLGVGLAAVAVKTWLKFRSSSAALCILKAAPEAQIADLRSLLPPHSGNGDDSSAENSHGNICNSYSSKAVGPLVLVRGKVQATSAVDPSLGTPGPIVAHNSGEQAAVFLKTQTCLYNEWRGFFGWGPDWRSLFGGPLKEQITTSIRKIPFVLVQNDGKQNSEYVHIHLNDSMQPLPLTTVYHHLDPLQATPYTVFQALFGRGYPVGLLDQERILPLGKDITAVGHLSSAQDGHPMLNSCKFLPCFLSDLSKEHLLEEIEISKGILFWGGIIISVAASFVLCYSTLRNWQKFKDWRRMRQTANRPREESNANAQSTDGSDSNRSNDDGDVPDGELCVVCLCRRRRSAFIPCGHHVCCTQCAQRVEREIHPKCPVCRQNVRNSVRIYDS